MVNLKSSGFVSTIVNLYPHLNTPPGNPIR